MGLLDGKHVLITAGATGIGKATVLACAKEGAAVVATSRAKPTDDRAVKVVEEAKKLGTAPITFMTYDCNDFDSAAKVFKDAYDFMGGLDTLVYCAASPTGRGPLEDLTRQDFQDQLNTHLIGMHYANVEAFKYMKAAGGGSIIDISSDAGLIGVVNEGAYSAAKGGVYAYTRVAAREWGKYNIRVNSLNPFVVTEGVEMWVKYMDPELKAIYQDWVDHMLLPNSPAPASAAADSIVFLASDMACHMTGQIITVDHGWTMVR